MEPKQPNETHASKTSKETLISELTERQSPERLRAQRFLIFMGLMLLLMLLCMTVYFSLLVPLLISMLLTYLLLPFTNRLERLGWSRTGLVAVTVLLFLVVTGLAIARLVPVLFSQGQLLLQLIPSAFNAVLDHWIPLVDASIVDLGFTGHQSVRGFIEKYDFFSTLEAPFENGLNGLWMTGTSLLGGMVNIMLIPLITFFLLKDYPSIKDGVRALVPVDLRGPVRVVIHKIDLTLRSVIKGQVTVAAILTVLYVIGFSVVGLQSAIAIGVVAGICRIVPYLDVIVGGTLSTIVLLSNFPGWGQILGVFLVFMIVQGVDGAFITPRVIGERVGLHPVAVIMSVLAFGHWLGFWGVLLAIPIVAVIKALMSAALPFYHKSKVFRPSWFPPESPAPLESDLPDDV